jgi:hypothetical protein
VQALTAYRLIALARVLTLTHGLAALSEPESALGLLPGCGGFVGQVLLQGWGGLVAKVLLLGWVAWWFRYCCWAAMALQIGGCRWKWPTVANADRQLDSFHLLLSIIPSGIHFWVTKCGSRYWFEIGLF